MNYQRECPICKSMASNYPDYHDSSGFFECDICGRFQFFLSKNLEVLDNPKLSSYVFYNRFLHNEGEYRYYTNLDIETCDKYNEDFESGNYEHGRPVHIDSEIVNAWYPKTFSERVDRILDYLYMKTKYVGEPVRYDKKELYGVLLMDRIEIKTQLGIQKRAFRNEYDLNKEMESILEYLIEEGYIKYGYTVDDDVTKSMIAVILTPRGYSRLDKKSKYSQEGRQVLVAMQFGDETRNLREAIRKGIQEAGYIAIFIDEVQHNDFITPELLKHIKDSRFVVVDLTHKNNGAYFEEGYAMGLDKPVIQLCKKNTDLHFDIAQKNTIIWETEEDIPKMLYNRILATID